MPKIFISYSRRDNTAFGPKALQWVNTFETALKETLGQRVDAGQVEIWRDTRDMDEATTFDDVIERALDSSDLLITVLSLHYLGSAYCRKELQRFGLTRLERNDLRVGTHSRIVKVYRAAVDRQALRSFATPEQLAREIDATEGFQMFCIDGDDYRDALLHPEGIALVWQKADDLSRAIRRIIDEGAHAVASGTAAARWPVVYLARCAGDMREARDALRRELEDRKCSVLPDGEMPEEADAYAAAVRECLARAHLSVHLLGRRYGAIADGDTDSVVQTQLKLAMEVQRAGFFTLVWSPLPPSDPDPGPVEPSGGAGPDAGPGVPGSSAALQPEPRMRELREQLVKLSMPKSRMEYLRSNASTLHAMVRSRLEAPATPLPPPPEAAAEGHAIYLVCDKADRSDTEALKYALKQQGFSVTRPPTEGTAKELDADHQRCLVSTDIVVVVWGKVREPWVRKKLADVRQAAGLGRRQPMRGCILLIGPPDTQAKSEFEAPEGVSVLPAADVPRALQRLLT